MIKKTAYEAFENYILRTPLLCVDFYKDLTADRIVSDENLKKTFEYSVIKEALFLASPILYNELEKWVSGKMIDEKKIDRLRNSLLKYVARMSSRSTPFGLFAGCSVGKISTNTQIELADLKSHKRHTRLDMNYLVSLSQNLSKNTKIKEQLLFYPNSSIYKLNNQVRYVEYEYVNSLRNHHIIGVDDSIYLEEALKHGENGILYNDLINLLIDEDNSFEVVKEFVDDLIDSQIFISELEPSVSGTDFLDYILSVLSKINDTGNEIKILKSVKEKLALIDTTIGNPPSSYIEISTILEGLETDFDIKYLFQTDLIVTTPVNNLSDSFVVKIKEGMSFLNKITPVPKETSLKKFKESFIERYEEREVALEKVLDVESGIGYKQNQNSPDINPLIDDLRIAPKGINNEQKEIKWSLFNTIFQEKLIESYANKAYSIVFEDDEVASFEENWDDIPDTFSCWTELLVIDGQEKIVLGGCGDSSAANLLARFCHADIAIENYVNKIVAHEATTNKGKIVAEIIHLPESRIGNVVMRPRLREFEIPYLAKSVLPSANQIKINDLMISVKSDTIFLRSKKLNKQIEPRLTNAHNYVDNSLPIYQFLAEMQTQNKRPSISIYRGPHSSEYKFIPRIEYKDLILAEAVWNVKIEAISLLYKVFDKDDDLLEEVRTLRKQTAMPQFVLLIQSDHELLINMENLSTIRMFLTTVKKMPIFQLKEFLYSNSGVVQNVDSKKHFANQLILSFYKS
ncbi:lantibiotic dehydratase family protein [Flavobacterium sp. ABG]|uniref:lantibiotic dehydratase family protein n=1 Tax=Flavobacterium sp. ABG TaxID=1423322 RepID=UPI000649ADED|nr:lantibiotic dehydratase family protein [Flavobacterium sp. ABG]KLT70295.1 hypothetical protein AB674_08815 [Flavobacterium sp. ABG]